MKFFVDTADVAEIKELAATGLLDGVTTNPSLVAKAGRDFKEIIAEICDVVAGPVSAEVAATDYEGMMQEARVLAKIAKNVAIKVPLTLDGLKACKALTGDGTMVNVTLCFSANQALLAAKAGATFVSPFIGRLDDIGSERHGRDPRDPHDLRQLSGLHDRHPRRLDPHREPREGGGPDRRRCRDRAAGDPEGAREAPADGRGSRHVRRRLEEDGPEDRLSSRLPLRRSFSARITSCN